MIARTGGASFIVEILRAWRDGQAVIPVEKDAPEPMLQRHPGPDIRLVKYTPGASGVPRGIFLTAEQIIADADQISSTMQLTPEVPNLAVVSMAHSYGFSNLVLPLLLHGVPLVLVSVPFPRVVEEACRPHESIVVAAVPSMWRAWHRSGILRSTPIHLALSAGAPLVLDLEIAVHADAGLKIHNFYGASECGGIAYDATSVPRPSGDLLGKPLHGVNLSLQADGRLLVKSAAVASAYDAPRADDLLGEGMYLTRDLCSVDENQNLYLTKTTGSAINVAGRKVSPAKVEAAILATGLVRRVRVFGIPSSDPERFEEIAAEVELLPGFTLDQLKSTLPSQLQSWEIPRHWR
ncbi:MAG: AMP-binding protein [Akkermansiaceae bacterium]|nr:AMP-binding protein [Akkermansiaceae bacterium]